MLWIWLMWVWMVLCDAAGWAYRKTRLDYLLGLPGDF